MSPHSRVTTLKEKETWVVTMICPICYVGGRDLNLPSVSSRNVDVFCLSPGNGGRKCRNVDKHQNISIVPGSRGSGRRRSSGTSFSKLE